MWDLFVWGVIILFALALLSAGWTLYRTRDGAVQEFQKRHPPNTKRESRTNMSSSIHLESVHSGRVTLNGMTFVIRDGQVTVNGQPWGPVGAGGTATPPAVSPPKIVLNQDGTITGPIAGDLIIEGPGPVTLIVQGDVHGSVDVRNGNVRCGAVTMSVEAGGDITCENVGMGVEAKGNVTCGHVGLSVEARGVVYRK